MSNAFNNIEQNLDSLFKKWIGSSANSIIQLPGSGSGRIYYRLHNNDTSAIGVFNTDLKENIAFLDFTKQFLKFRINVPEIYAEDLTQNIYLISDLGDLQLLTWLQSINGFSDEALQMYKKVIQELIRMQVLAGKSFDYSKCHQFANFNKESIAYDLNYFKTNYADQLKIAYNHNALTKEFDLFLDYLLSTTTNYFMFRDFQARNILIKDGEPWFIDYQGGRRGALQYDLVSLLFQAKAQIPENVKLTLLDYYIKVLNLFLPVSKDEFTEYYYAYALVRVLQTLGAYGLRGIIEKKKHFIESIPFAIKNLEYLQHKTELIKKLPELNLIISRIIHTEKQ